MRQVVYSPRINRLIYLHEKATPDYWDEHWRVVGEPPAPNPRDEVVRVTRKYLAMGSTVLEGGCGRANKVKALVDAGYNAIGVDFAEGTVQKALLDYPGLDIRRGDVRSLDFPDGSFDGYWSIGVIEHFWGGYDTILAEAKRVLRVRGLLFLTAPWFSPYRRVKAIRGGYQCSNFDEEPEAFYQFALDRGEVSRKLKQCGFKLLSWHGLASEISMIEDVTMFDRQIRWLLGSRGSIVKRIFRRVAMRGLNPFCGHSFLVIARTE